VLQTLLFIKKEVSSQMKAAEQSKSDVVRAYINRRPNATAMEVVRGIKREMGVDVSIALAAKIKRDSAAAPAKSSSGESQAGASKAEQIRQVAAGMGGKVRPRDVIAKLAEQGVTVSSAQVSTVLRAMGMKRRRRGRSPAAAVESVASTLTLDSLLAAKRLVNQLGSVEAAKTAVDALAKLG
jgi:transposase